MANSADFTLVQLRYFAVAAELGSMTAAARQLTVSQSAVSAAVAYLERVLGLQLFVRHHAKGLSLTRSGARFLGEAQALLAHADELAGAARGLGGAMAGDLAVGCFTSLAPFYLPKLLADFAARYPGVQVSVTEGQAEALQRALLDGSCEVALLYDLGLADDLETELLTAAPPYALVAANHRLASVSGVHLADLAEEPMVLLNWPLSREYFQSLMRRAGVQPRISHTTSSYETVRALVAAGQGFSVLNQRPATETTYDGGRVIALPLLDRLPPLPVVLAFVRGTRPTRRAAAFAARCRAILAHGRAEAASE
jgi:DNA-binding transcriptional LysR family regulator